MQVIGLAEVFFRWKVHRHFFNRGSKSRNKVAVGEPAAGSFSDDTQKTKPIPGGCGLDPSKLRLAGETQTVLSLFLGLLSVLPRDLPFFGRLRTAPTTCRDG